MGFYFTGPHPQAADVQNMREWAKDRADLAAAQARISELEGLLRRAVHALPWNSIGDGPDLIGAILAMLPPEPEDSVI